MAKLADYRTLRWSYDLGQVTYLLPTGCFYRR